MWWITENTLCIYLFPCVRMYVGEALLWYERCRIKHLLTQRYLAVEKRGDRFVLTLREKKPTPDFDADTTFRLYPVITGEEEIKYETYARITHVATKTWLHALKGLSVCISSLCIIYVVVVHVTSTVLFTGVHTEGGPGISHPKFRSPPRLFTTKMKFHK